MKISLVRCLPEHNIYITIMFGGLISRLSIFASASFFPCISIFLNPRIAQTEKFPTKLAFYFLRKAEM